MSRRSPSDPAGSRELVAILAGGLLVLVCCAGPALLAAGVLGAAGGVLRNPVLLGLAAVAVAVAVDTLVRRRGSHGDAHAGGPPPADSAASDPTAAGRGEGSGPAEPLDRKG